MRNRIMALIAALAVIMTGGAAMLTLGGSAASAAVASYSGARGWYIDANGIPRYLPTGPNAVPGQNGDYPNMWFKGLTLDPQPQPVTVVQKVAPAPVATDESAPVLARNGDPTTSAVPLKWTAANPPGDDTVYAYEVRYRKALDASWITVNKGSFLSGTMSGLSPATLYYFQVRAKYNTSVSSFGPYSNTVSATTDALASSSS